jgi:hypothetical protein
MNSRMDLKDFVKETLTQIIQGVKEAQPIAQQYGGVVSPKYWQGGDKSLMQSDNGEVIRNVHFDVALTVAEGTGTKGGIGVFAGVVSLGSAGQSSSHSTEVSRVQFFVPVLLPISTK